MNLTILFDMQKKLDAQIDIKRKKTQPKLTNKDILIQKTLALIIEAGEYVNEVQSFKYWKNQKNIDEQKITEEFADLLHFLINLAYAYEVNPIIEPKILNKDINIQFQELFYQIAQIISVLKTNDFQTIQNQILKVFEIAIGSFVMLGFSYAQLFQAYFYKNQKNFKRIYSNY
ncbi:dimeric dUTPase (all-alpha-NTP-PPase superfamily) [Mycoplasmopsis mustelae]|uniref:Dimeric dUTPase (All-alpha-NTP-PPase superfamily) n=1 Tax=Mycoplasmopsis mustelae TaxID=171289 RepID=A0A4R7UCQ4_9BACT|nr:dUTP diphosphatase [Mycoplasmopsis mustelae]TDV24169.1 dimeric dUTPase (all-alpha-NTP-PPase superfamily) [Mycoplasmopsis mustelae]